MRGDPEDIPNGGDGWLSGTCECRVCSHIQVSVWPASVLEPDDMECSNCGCMTAMPVSLIGSDGEEVAIDRDDDEEGWIGF